MLDSERNPGGGLAIEFWSDQQRRASDDTEALARPFDEAVVIKAMSTLAYLEFVPLELRYPCGCLGHNFPGIVNKPMRLLALQHERCVDCFVSDWINPEVGWEGAPFQQNSDDVETDVAFLASILSGAYSGEFGHSVRSFRTPRRAVGGREATDVCVSR